MTTSNQGAGRSLRSAPSSSWQATLDSTAGITLVVALAVVIRLLLAPKLGFYGDLRYFREWAGRLQDTGLRHFYEPGYFVDYPPGYLYILSLLGRITHTPSYSLLKLPILFGDLALAWASGVLASRLTPDSVKQRVPVRALVMVAVLFNPAVLGIGAAWGQVDSIPSALVITTLLLLLTGRRSLSRDLGGLCVFAVAIAIKPQSGFLAPVLAYLLIRRYVLTAPAGQRLVGLGRALGISIVSGGLWAVSGLPFGKSPGGLVDFYKQSARTYPVTSANAFNLWGVVGNFRRDSTLPYTDLAGTTRVLGLSAQTFGTLIVAIGVLVVLWFTHVALRRGANEIVTIIAASVGVNLVAYTFLTRMHERYMFPVLACLAPLALCRGFRAVYWTLSGLFVLNLWFPYILYNSQWNNSGRVGHVWAMQWKPVTTWLFGNVDATDAASRRVWSLLVVAVTFAYVAQFVLRAIGGIPDSSGMPTSRVPSSPAATTAGSATSPATATSPGIADRSDAGTLAVGTPPTGLLTSARALFAPPDADAPAGNGRGTWVPWAIVGLACAFGLLALRVELRPARTLNDTTFHEQMIRWASGQLQRGRLPLDGWFSDLTAGSSFFHHYQSFPYTATAIVGRVVHTDPQTIYLWMLYLLLSLWPISVYVGARLLGWGRWIAAIAAVIAPLLSSTPGYGYEHGSYTFQGWGVYTQLWGMWLLPITWGLVWRAISRRRGYALAALAMAFTIATHLMTGYLAILCFPVLGLLAARGFLGRLRRTALLAIGSLVTAAWVLVPLLADKSYSAQSVYYKGTLYNDSYGAKKILSWLLHGDLFDKGHFPIITILMFVGLAVCLLRFRIDERARVLIGLWAFSLVLYFGRVTWKRVIDLLPGSGDLQMHRFIIGVQMAGIVLAAVGAATLGRLAIRLGSDALASAKSVGSTHVRNTALGVAVGAVGLLALSPAWRAVWRYDRGDANFISSQRNYDATDGVSIDALIREADARGDGRIYAGTRGNWGSTYKVGYVPVLHEISHNDGDGIGFTFRTVQSLTTDVEASFDETNPAEYEALNIKYVLVPHSRKPGVPAKLIDSKGSNDLYEVTTTGYFQVVDRIGVVTADRTNLVAANQNFRTSKSALENVYPAVAFAGHEPPASAFSSAPAGSPGAVLAQTNRRANGWFSAKVTTTRQATVLLKASYDPRWHVTVDGKSAKAIMMAPSLVGVDVPAGDHTVVFSYHAYPYYPELVALGVFTLAGLAIWTRRRSWITDRLLPRRRASTVPDGA
jgi:Gpi18-like mannosyltransferase